MVASSPADHKSKELALRLISAAVLIPFALYVVATGGAILALSCAVFAGLMGFEWARMTASPVMPFAAGLAAMPLVVLVFSTWSLALAVFAGGMLLILLLHPATISERIAASFGVAYTGGLPLALVLLRDGDWNGQAAALIVMGTVWASDSGAYFAGRGFGGPPLSPRDSPSKTWSGAFGALLCSGLCGLIAAGLLDAPRVPWFIAGVIISIAAQWGDLFESSLKRRFGIKDSSGFLPGHGGIMDRVDGLGMACVVAAGLLWGIPDLSDLLGLEPLLR